MTVEFLQLQDNAIQSLPYKAGILSLLCMMIVGLYIFRKVPSQNMQEQNA